MRAFENSTPITDVREALELLAPKMGRWVGSYLHDGYCTDAAYVEVVWEQPPPRGSSSQYYLVAEDRVEEIKRRGWVKGTPMVGYTDQHKLQLSERGSAQLLAWRDEDKRAAHALLVPGEHGWSSVFDFRGIHTLLRGEPGDWKEGHLFANPLGQFFIVLLKDKQVVQVDSERRPL